MQEYLVRRADLTSLEQLVEFLAGNEFVKIEHTPAFRAEGGFGYSSIKMQRGDESGALVAVQRTPDEIGAAIVLSLLLPTFFPADLRQLLEVALELEDASKGLYLSNTVEVVGRNEIADKLLEIIESEEVAEASRFRKELEHLINRHSKENGSDTPDFILAEYLAGCLDNFDVAVQAREQWYGRKAGGGEAIIGKVDLAS